ncbi:MAG TPA: peptidoglycan DD-metalloendopeptidase family protein [Caulobacteraceae bacterium]|jgi:septal ring factor EnvC (AmiA/AmiB activator)|nr:peptidoglycan DD-metalloendopeptidase family protein [Caulobacteraceae bacterium]
MRRALLIAATLLIAVAPSHAQTGSQADALKAEAQAVANEAAALKTRLAELMRQQQQASARAGPQQAKLNALNAEEEGLRAEMDRNRGELGRLLTALELYSKDPPPALLVSPRSANDAVTAAILMRAVTPSLQQRAKVLTERAEAYQQVRREAALAEGAVFTDESETLERRAEIERLIGENAGLEARLRADQSAATPQARAQAEQDAALGGLVAGIGGQEPRAPLIAGDPGRLQAPVVGTRLAAQSGWSWRTGAGAQVFAPASGRVEYAGPLKGWGNVLVIGLGGDWRVVMAGLDRVQVRPGAQVSSGQGVGAMGLGTRESGAPQLYMELRRGPNVADPARRLDAG